MPQIYNKPNVRGQELRYFEDPTILPATEVQTVKNPGCLLGAAMYIARKVGLESFFAKASKKVTF